MVLLVPFDGSDLSQTALERAVEYAEYTGEDVLTLAVIPEDAEYAVECGWLQPDERFDLDEIAERLELQARNVSDNIDFRVETPEDVSSMASVTTDVVRTIRTVAHEVDASIVFIGSENAGRVTSPLCSVGAPVSRDPSYDVHIVRHAA